MSVKGMTATAAAQFSASWVNHARAVRSYPIPTTAVCTCHSQSQNYMERTHKRAARVRVTGSGPTKGMPVFIAARQRGSSSGQGAHKGCTTAHCPKPPGTSVRVSGAAVPGSLQMELL
eukprot:364763-Chlamydomonas_euryale.AAC.3